MSKYIDGDALFSEITACYRWALGEPRKAYRKVLDMICEADDQDVEKVIRCKDCIYYQDNNDGYPHPDCKWNTNETPDADDFCSAGERRANK